MSLVLRDYQQEAIDAAWRALGTGYCFRSAAEFYLLGTTDKPRQGARSIRNLIVAPVRERRPGWDAWGNQADRFGKAA